MEKHCICPICNEAFIVTNRKDSARKYCYNCSPAGRAGDYTPLYHAMKNQLIKERGGACEICGYNKSTAALCFHHKDPSQKIFELSIKSGSHCWNDWQLEANKCSLLCLNCHAELHANQRQ